MTAGPLDQKPPKDAPNERKCLRCPITGHLRRCPICGNTFCPKHYADHMGKRV